MNQLNINRKERREEKLRKIKEKKKTPEYGMNSAKIRIQKKQKKEDNHYHKKGWVLIVNV